MRNRAYGLLWLLFSVTAPAHAAPITVRFEGTLSGVYDPLGVSWQGNLQIGDPFQYEITFDDSATGTPSAEGTYYSLPAAEVVAHVGTFAYAGPGLTVELIDDYVPGPTDFINLSGGLYTGAAASIDMYAVGAASLLSSENLADVVWTSLVGQPIGILIYQYGPMFQLIETSAGGLVSSVTLVPEPTSAFLIGTALAVFLARHSRLGPETTDARHRDGDGRLLLR